MHRMNSSTMHKHYLFFNLTNCEIHCFQNNHRVNQTTKQLYCHDKTIPICQAALKWDQRELTVTVDCWCSGVMFVLESFRGRSALISVASSVEKKKKKREGTWKRMLLQMIWPQCKPGNCCDRIRSLKNQTIHLFNSYIYKRNKKWWRGSIADVDIDVLLGFT